MAAPVMRNHAEAILSQEKHLAIPCIGTERPTVRKRYNWAFAPVFVVDRPILHRNCAHKIFSSNSSASGMFCGSDLFSSYEQRGASILHEEHDKFRRFGLACIPPNNVNIVRAFVEGLTGAYGRFLSASHLHHDRAFEHIDKPICI